MLNRRCLSENGYAAFGVNVTIVAMNERRSRQLPVQPIGVIKQFFHIPLNDNIGKLHALTLRDQDKQKTGALAPVFYQAAY